MEWKITFTTYRDLSWMLLFLLCTCIMGARPMTWDQGNAGSRITGGTELCPWSRHFILCVVLIQPRKLPDMTGMYTVNSNNKTNQFLIMQYGGTSPRSSVSNMFGNRWESDCRSRGRVFDPGLVPYFPGDWSWNNSYYHFPPFWWIIQEGLLSVTSESMCTKYWLTACSSLPRKKCGLVNWPSRHDHSCWLGT